MVYRKKVIKVLKREIEMGVRKKSRQLRTAKKERIFLPMDTSLFTTIEGTVYQIELQL